MRDQLKFLLIIPFFYPHRGGAQKYAEELYVAIKGQHPEIQIDVLCYNTDGAAKFEKYRGLNVYRVPCYTLIPGKFVLPKINALVIMLAKLAKNKYDFVNTHTAFFDTTWWAWLYAKKIGAKSVFTGHAPGHPTHQSKTIEIVGKLIHLTFGKWSVRKYDIYTYANSKSKDFFEKYLGAKLGGTVIPISINDKVFNTERDAGEYSIPSSNVVKSKDNILITYIGRMIETKGVNYLYEAIKRIQREVPDTVWQNLKFVFAGPGVLNKNISEFVNHDKLQDNLFLTQDISYEQVAQLLKASDLFISPSSHSEGLPNTILEAGACGCLVIATNSGSIGDIVIDKKTGLLVLMKSVTNLAEAIIWALTHKEESRYISQAMSNLILQGFTWNKTAEKYLVLMRKILS